MPRKTASLHGKERANGTPGNYEMLSSGETLVPGKGPSIPNSLPRKHTYNNITET